MRIRSLIAVCSLSCGLAHAQSVQQMQAELDVKLEASQRALRSAIVNLRDIRFSSCKLGNAESCDLAKLSDIELALLDLEVRYQRSNRNASTSDDKEKFKKLKEAAEEARNKVSELAQLVN